MSPDVYLHFAAIFLGYFVKVAVAFLLCWLLARLLASPRQRFAMWMAFMLGSGAYWIYSVTSSFLTTTVPAPEIQPVAHTVVPRIVHEFLVPARFEPVTVLLGRGLIVAYISGVLLLLLEGVRKRIKLHFLLRHGQSPSPELQHLFAEMCRHFRVRHCDLLILPKVTSPATVCWWRPRIVLPQVCEQLSDEPLMADVLYHELAHVARRDYFWSSVNDLICRFLFFHPGVWQARKQMQIYRELACDLAVVAARPEHRADYAHTLTRVARLCLPRKYPAIGVDFAAVPSLLTHRVHAILNDQENSSWSKKLARGAAAFSLIGAYGFLCFAVVVAVAFAPSTQPQPRAQVQAMQKLPIHPERRHKIKREPAASEAEGLITESPAFRLKSADGSSVHDAPVFTNSREQGSLEAGGPNWAAPGGAHTRSTGATVGSIIAATVGTVVGADRDRDNKHKESSNHQDPAGLPMSH